MQYRIVEKGAFRIIGLHRRVTLQYRGINPEIAAMYNSLTEADIAALDALSDVEPHGLLSASLNFEEGRAEGTLLDQYIGVATTRTQADSWSVLHIEPSTWVVFTVRGAFPDALQDTWARIYAEWLLTSGYEVAPGPEILWTDDEQEDERSPDYLSEIWIPITRKPM